MQIIRPIYITDAMMTSSNVPETDYAAWSVGTAYTAGNRCIVTTAGIHKIYQALVNVTGGSSPEVDALATVPNWLLVSSTNRWKPFDTIVGAQASQATSITYRITPGQLCDSIAFLNVNAVSIEIKMTDPVDGVVYDEVIDLLSTVVTGVSETYDWYSYFFSSYFMISDVVRLNLPLYLNAYIDITITSTGGTVLIGEIVLGLQTVIGITATMPTFGTTDYSTKTADAFGVLTVVKRAFSKRMAATLILNNLSMDNIANLLAFYQSELLVWIGDPNYSSLIIYGYCKDYEFTANLKTSTVPIEIEGLT